jgi:hypothetical protein
MKYLIELIGILGWLVGIVLAKGFWSTLFAVLIPLWGIYLTIEHLVLKYLV